MNVTPEEAQRLHDLFERATALGERRRGMLGDERDALNEQYAVARGDYRMQVIAVMNAELEEVANRYTRLAIEMTDVWESAANLHGWFESQGLNHDIPMGWLADVSLPEIQRGAVAKMVDGRRASGFNHDISDLLNEEGLALFYGYPRPETAVLPLEPTQHHNRPGELNAPLGH